MHYIRSLIQLTKQAVSILPKQCQRHFWWMMCILSLSAVLESLATVSLGPFLAIVTETNRVWRHEKLTSVLHGVGIKTDTQLIIASGGALVLAMLLTNLGKAFLLRKRLHFNEDTLLHLSVQTLRRYLEQPYEFFVTRNMADVHRFSTQECLYLVTHVFDPLLIIFERCLVVIVLCAIIAAASPMVAFVISVGLVLIYAIIAVSNKRHFGSLGKKMKKAKRASFRFVKEILGSIKLIKLNNVEHQVVNRFERHVRVFTNCKAEVSIRGALPRFALEVAGVAVIVTLTIYFALQRGGLEANIAVLGLYGFAFYRLLPSFQLIFADAAKLIAARSHLAEFQEEVASFTVRSREESEDSTEHILPDGDIAVEFRNVSYQYPNGSEPALNNVSLQVPANSAVGIIGRTGSGKTTLLNALLGLLNPQAGEIVAFGNRLTPANSRSWRKLIGFVPQDITLFDATVAENIAFTLDSELIDLERVIEAARLAAIHDVIDSLPDGYHTRVGDNGIRFSGGQRQRIAIARALYHQPPVLVFDEATSHLDRRTEVEFMQALDRLHGTRTMIVVTHRPETIEKCNLVFRISDGTASLVTKNSGTAVIES